MGKSYENKMHNKNTMNEVRQILERYPEFEEHFSNSMEPVKSLLKTRFQNMKIKEGYIECASSASKDEIDEFFNIIHLIDETIKKDKLSTKDVESSEQLKNFITLHCRATLYTFQMRKCLSEDCFICSTLQPIRLKKDTFDSMGFLPDPMLHISNNHDQDFKDIFKKETMKRD